MKSNNQELREECRNILYTKLKDLYDYTENNDQEYTKQVDLDFKSKM